MYIDKIKQTWKKTSITTEYLDEGYRKALPEAEALIIVKKEHDGSFNILSEKSEKTTAWFISHTSVLNLIDKKIRITWQPEEFIKFSSTLYPIENEKASNYSFDTILWGIAQSGLSVIDESAVSKVFGGIIDQVRIDLSEQHHIYEKNLAKKYGEPIESVMERLSPTRKPIAAIQLANEAVQIETQKREIAEKEAAQQKSRAKRAEEALIGVEKLQRKVAEKKERAKRKSRKLKSSKKTKKQRKK